MKNPRIQTRHNLALGLAATILLLLSGSVAPAEGEGLCDRNWRSAASAEGAVVDVALPYPKAATAAMTAATTPKADATKGCAEIQRMRAPPVLSL